ncbi:MAG: hypothetical protein JKY30_04485 [Flavobacteriales bacterium]|nr:hypothetical protein [Flavobacteriales bacterium]
MIYLISIIGFSLGVAIVYQIGCGFPLISNIRDKKRQKRNDAIQKIRKENEKKIKSLNKHLKTEDEIETYITLNRFNLPIDNEWKPILPQMIKGLQSIGWNTEIPIYTKFSYGRYSISIISSDIKLRTKTQSVFHKYLDISEGLWEEEE